LGTSRFEAIQECMNEAGFDEGNNFALPKPLADALSGAQLPTDVSAVQNLLNGANPGDLAAKLAQLTGNSGNSDVLSKFTQLLQGAGNQGGGGGSIFEQLSQAASSLTGQGNGNPFGSFGSLFGNRRGKRAAEKGQKKPMADDKTKMRLYKIGYSNELIEDLCPTLKDDIQECIAGATGGQVDLRRISPQSAKSRYCSAQSRCDRSEVACEAERAKRQQTRCKCDARVRSKLSNQCGVIPAEPGCGTNSRQLTRVAKAEAGTSLCDEEIPTLHEVIGSIKKDRELEKVDRKELIEHHKSKLNNGNNGNNRGGGRGRGRGRGSG
jgi:hypothetical protein